MYVLHYLAGKQYLVAVLSSGASSLEILALAAGFKLMKKPLTMSRTYMCVDYVRKYVRLHVFNLCFVLWIVVLAR